ncbi:MAG TPA: TIGR03936 family radical SAM-associated protein [Jatrophihabitans sp.]|nr:TIGR03936 family radical SAM-associated protein [Jatrophihabitans sp.]
MATRQPSGPPPPPTVCRIRLRYAKRGRLRFTSHRDVARVFERAVRRTALPIAHSAGFSPHPKISWVGAAPTGVASEAEYVEIGLTAPRSAADLAAQLDAVLPDGLDVLDAVVAHTGSLADRMEASRWELRLPGCDPTQARDALAAFLASDQVLVSRRTKGGMRDVDTRAAVLTASGATAPDDSCVILQLVVRHTTPVVRPDDVLAGLRAVAPLDLGAPLVATRLAQGPFRPGEADAEPGIDDPLAPDRAAGGSVDTSLSA